MFTNVNVQTDQLFASSSQAEAASSPQKNKYNIKLRALKTRADVEFSKWKETNQTDWCLGCYANWMLDVPRHCKEFKE